MDIDLGFSLFVIRRFVLPVIVAFIFVDSVLFMDPGTIAYASIMLPIMTGVAYALGFHDMLYVDRMSRLSLPLAGGRTAIGFMTMVVVLMIPLLKPGIRSLNETLVSFVLAGVAYVITAYLLKREFVEPRFKPGVN